ncbi:hypothetical protein FRC02_008911 [Tulasnella sp. 418]|nr:hypothetical protein FRC02_008911 [Tulasnella sp. 418]
MKIPSATGIVLASLAFSGSTLSAPTLPPPSPNPNSPNPGVNSPHPLDSPRVDSPRSLHQAFFNGHNKVGRREPAIRSGSGSRRSIPQWAKRSETPEESPQPLEASINTEGLGIDIPGAILGPLVGHSGSTIVEVLPRQATQDADVIPEALATPMTRSLAQLSTRDVAEDGVVQAEGLGIVDKKTADTVVDALHKVASTLPPPLDKLVDSIGPVVGGLLGPNSPQRRQLRYMRRQVSAPASTETASSVDSDQTVNAEGLGLLPPGTVSGLVGTVGGIVQPLPLVGGVLNGVLGTVGGVVDGLVSRDVHNRDDGELERRSFIPTDPQNPSPVYPITSSTPSSQSPHYLVTTANGAVVDLADAFSGKAIQQLPSGIQFIPQAIEGVPNAVEGTLSEGAAHFVPSYASGTLSQVQEFGQGHMSTLGAPSQVMQQATNILPPQIGGIVTGASGLLDTVTGFVPGLGNIRIPQQASSAIPHYNAIIGYLPNGTPVFGNTQASAYEASGNSPSPQRSGQQTAPMGGIVGTATGVISSLPGGSAAAGILQNLHLPGVSGEQNGGLLGIMSEGGDDPDTTSSVNPASGTSVSSSPTSSSISPSITQSTPSVAQAPGTGAEQHQAALGGSSDVSSLSNNEVEESEPNMAYGSEYDSDEETAASEDEEESEGEMALPISTISTVAPTSTSKSIDPALATQTASALVKIKNESVQSVEPDGVTSTIGASTTSTVPGSSQTTSSPN